MGESADDDKRQLKEEPRAQVEVTQPGGTQKWQEEAVFGKRGHLMLPVLWEAKEDAVWPRMRGKCFREMWGMCVLLRSLRHMLYCRVKGYGYIFNWKRNTENRSKRRAQCSNVLGSTRAHCLIHCLISWRDTLSKTTVIRKVFNWGLACHFRGLICYLHGRKHGAVTESYILIPRQSERFQGQHGLLKPQSPPLLTYFLQQGHTS